MCPRLLTCPRNFRNFKKPLDGDFLHSGRSARVLFITEMLSFAMIVVPTNPPIALINIA